MLLTMPKKNEAVSRCVKCGGGLGHFAGYIPEKGEVCMACYQQFARENEKKSI